MSDHLDRENTALRARVAELEAEATHQHWIELELVGRIDKLSGRVAELVDVLHMVGGILEKDGYHHALKQVRAILAKGRER